MDTERRKKKGQVVSSWLHNFLIFDKWIIFGIFRQVHQPMSLQVSRYVEVIWYRVTEKQSTRQPGSPSKKTIECAIYVINAVNVRQVRACGILTSYAVFSTDGTTYFFLIRFSAVATSGSNCIDSHALYRQRQVNYIGAVSLDQSSLF